MSCRVTKKRGDRAIAIRDKFSIVIFRRNRASSTRITRLLLVESSCNSSPRYVFARVHILFDISFHDILVVFNNFPFPPTRAEEKTIRSSQKRGITNEFDSFHARLNH